MRRRSFLIVSLLGLWACAGSAARPAPTPTPAAPSSAREPPLRFSLQALDGSVVTGENTRGRVTALLFVASYDLASQLAARRLNDAIARHVPRFNAVAIALESSENAVLVDVFRSTLNLGYPVAMAGAVEFGESEALATIERVPTLILLDRDGRPVFRHTGAFEAHELESWLRRAEA
ncbi:MAG: TlpA family protein disulfide reductase [Pseudomonadota bacterium]